MADPSYSTLSAVERAVRTAFAGSLPGIQAQRAVAPRPRPEWTPGQLPPYTRQAAALLLLYPSDDRPHFVLTVRSGELARHGGQVSLPGGGVEPGETVEHAALREAEEETGIDRRTVRILGVLTPLHVVVSGFELYPVVGISAGRPSFRPARGEVDRILEVPLADLLDHSRLGHMRLMRETDELDAPYFALEGERIWGATAMILSEFAWLLGHRPAAWD